MIIVIEYARNIQTNIRVKIYGSQFIKTDISNSMLVETSRDTKWAMLGRHDPMFNGPLQANVSSRHDPIENCVVSC